jgi:uncharacterized membrane protein YtjA (UPF0391 family)
MADHVTVIEEKLREGCGILIAETSIWASSHLGLVFVFLNYFKSANMLRWAIIFFIIAIIAAVFGFGGIAAGAVGIAKILFWIFVVLFVISLITGYSRRNR